MSFFSICDILYKYLKKVVHEKKIKIKSNQKRKGDKMVWNKGNYDLINDYLNEFCKSHDDEIYTDNITNFLNLSYSILEAVVNKDVYSNARFFSNKKLLASLPSTNLEHPLSGIEVLNLCNNFIVKYLSNGTINLKDSKENLSSGEEASNNYSIYKIDNSQLQREIDITLDYNYHDPVAIIHEFIHQLNLDENYALENKKEPAIRTLFTEGVSIYYETLMLRFMEEKGYDKKELAKVEHDRISNLFLHANQASQQLIFVRDYLYFGNIKDSSLEEAKRRNMITFPSLNIYQSISSMLALHISKESPANYDFFSSLYYVLGTSIAYWAIANDKEEMPVRMLKFNEDIATEKPVETALKHLGLKLNDNTNSLLKNAVEQEIIRNNKNLQEVSTIKK